MKDKGDFICPMPRAWNEIYVRLCLAAEEHGWDKPPVPLILAAWWDTSDSMKMLRWRDTVEWAERHGVRNLISDLTADQRHCIGDRWA